MNVKQTLKSRNSIYGSYYDGVYLRVQILDLIKTRYRKVHGIDMGDIDQSCIFDIVNKLTRIAVTPSHVDSWIDIAGYATLISETLESNDASK